MKMGTYLVMSKLDLFKTENINERVNLNVKNNTIVSVVYIDWKRKIYVFGEKTEVF